ncbi:hypothetical protein HQ576_14715, partial [bacterium]|nr:hypothetical protein [bacterium]
ATLGTADVLKITNRGDKAPLLLENFFVIGRNAQDVFVLARATNVSAQPLKNVALKTAYTQDFNWDLTIEEAGKPPRRARVGESGRAVAVTASSEAMRRAYRIQVGERCSLHYQLTAPINRWDVLLYGPATTLAPGASVGFRYVLSVGSGDAVPAPRTKPPSTEELLALKFRTERATAWRRAPIEPQGRVMLPQVIADIKKPKIRGLNLRAGFPQALGDLKTLKDWGANLVITHLGKPEHVRAIIAAGHKLGLEMFLSGRGSFTKGPPSFDALYAQPVPPTERPDSHGQDEDHYYWHAIQPTRDFQPDFGKPLRAATHEEKTLYWSRCFVDKWRSVRAAVRTHAPNTGIWFYIPSPCVAGVDPLDHHGLFFREVATLGESLTVFPFYYGVEYSQAEYMCRRWKDAGVHRVAFLPMRGFLTRPSQFLRVITAARRGQADGTCGFAFPVGAEKAGEAWQWKSVMLAAWANFPTPELPAYCFIEEPAELVEALAARPIVVEPHGTDVADFVAGLKGLLPDDERERDKTARPLRVVVGGPASLGKAKWACGPGKGVVQMRGDAVSLCGADAAGVANAMKLFARFAELARAEGRPLQPSGGK